MYCLFIVTPHNASTSELQQFLYVNHVDCEVVCDPFSGIQRVQEQHFDLIILDAEACNAGIDRAIRLLKGCDPYTRIIVKTNTNTRDLETLVRKEQVFYYHVNSLGVNDLQIAVKSALQLSGTV